MPRPGPPVLWPKHQYIAQWSNGLRTVATPSPRASCKARHIASYDRLDLTLFLWCTPHTSACEGSMVPAHVGKCRLAGKRQPLVDHQPPAVVNLVGNRQFFVHLVLSVGGGAYFFSFRCVTG